METDRLQRRANTLFRPRPWSALAVVTLLCPLAGCTAMHWLEGKLPGVDEEDLGIVTRSYPDWGNKARQTLDRIPNAGEKKQGTAPEEIAAAASNPAVTNLNATVAHETPVSENPAVPQSAPTSPPPSPAAQGAEAPPQPAPIVKPVAAGVPAANAPAAAPPAESPSAHPTPKHPLAVAGAEEQPVTTPHPAAAGDKGDKKKEPTPAERLSALIKQRSEFLSALKAEVTRRRSSTEDEEELVQLEKELRLVQLAGEQPDEAVREIEMLEGAEKDAFAHLLMGLATWMSADEARRPTLRNAKIVREIRDAAAELAAASKLDVRNLAFCEKVESYGWYTEFAKSQFKPKQQVILYAEVENFAAVRIAEESFETELQGSYQIFDSGGKLIDERELPLDKELCRNYRRDYFLAYLIYLPDGLSSGKYRLELQIEDKKGSALTQETKPRRSVSDSGLRGDKEAKLAVTPSSASSYKGRKLGTGTIEFTIK